MYAVCIFYMRFFILL